MTLSPRIYLGRSLGKMNEPTGKTKLETAERHSKDGQMQKKGHAVIEFR